MLGFNSISEIIMFTIVIIIALVFHELSHGFVSFLLGDPTAKDAGRLTLNPLSHIDPFGLIAIFLIHFGWAKPVPINPEYYKNRRVGVILTSLAGPVANLLIAFIGSLVYVGLFPESPMLSYFLINLIEINVALAIFNMLPIPPLDGSKIFGSLFGGKIEELIFRIERTGMIIILVLFWIPPVSNALSNCIISLTNQLINLASIIIFHQPIA